MSTDELKLPRQFGSYLLKQKIASGGMAELYLAELAGPGGFVKPLVIKMIHRAYSDDPRFLSMFTEEAKIVSGLTHGNIVPIFDFGQKEGLWYLALEFIDGVDVATLADICRISGINLPLEIALFIGERTAAALSYAHEATDAEGNTLGLVHRDVSPQNILVSRSGEVKLCDFGLATLAVGDNTASNDIKGKLRYLSPEQARGRGVDRRSDLFSLGVILYELIAGHHPVPMGTEVTVLQTLSGNEGFGALFESAPWIPREVADIVDRAVAFSPDDRFSNAEELRAKLSKILHRRFPDFTPQYLADLVVRVQSASEALSSDDEDSMTRAKLASFASKSRAASAGGEIPPLHRVGRVRRLALPGLLAATAIGLIALYVGEHIPGAPPKPTDAGPALASRETQRTSKEDDGQETPKQVPPQNPVSVSKDTGAESKPPPEPEEPPTKSDRGRKRSIADRRLRGIGTVDINASPWADVSIDGVDYTTTPILGLKLPAGKHKATFVNPEIGITKTRTFEVKPDQTVRLLVEME